MVHAVADWCRFNDAETIFIDPGSPWQNALTERYWHLLFSSNLPLNIKRHEGEPS